LTVASGNPFIFQRPVDDLIDGPPPAKFYADYGTGTEAAYLTQLLADLAAVLYALLSLR